MATSSITANFTMRDPAEGLRFTDFLVAGNANDRMSIGSSTARVVSDGASVRGLMARAMARHA